MARNGGSHYANRAGAGDEHIFAQHVELQRCVHSITKRIEDCLHVALDTRRVRPDVCVRQNNIFRKCTGAVYANALRGLAQMAPARQAVAAAPAHHVAFTAHNFAGVKFFYLRPNRNNLSHKFMPHNHRHRNCLLRPRIPVEDVQIRATDARAQHLDQHFGIAASRHRYILQP